MPEAIALATGFASGKSSWKQAALSGSVEKGVFVAVGHHPNTNLFQGVLQLDAEGSILPIERTMTSIPGVLVAGDVAYLYYRLAIIAAGDGSRAEIDVRHWLEHQQAREAQKAFALAQDM